MPEMWFPQVGAKTHTDKYFLNVLRKLFPGHVLSLRGDLGWPTQSPDLNILCDLILWGYHEEKLFVEKKIGKIGKTLPSRPSRKLRDRIIDEV